VDVPVSFIGSWSYNDNEKYSGNGIIINHKPVDAGCGWVGMASKATYYIPAAATGGSYPSGCPSL
jgi:hypothetical protein